MLAQTAKKEQPEKILRSRKDSKAHSPYDSLEERIRTNSFG